MFVYIHIKDCQTINLRLKIMFGGKSSKAVLGQNEFQRQSQFYSKTQTYQNQVYLSIITFVSHICIQFQCTIITTNYDIEIQNQHQRYTPGAVAGVKAIRAITICCHFGKSIGITNTCPYRCTLFGIYMKGRVVIIILYSGYDHCLLI